MTLCHVNSGRKVRHLCWLVRIGQGILLTEPDQVHIFVPEEQLILVHRSGVVKVLFGSLNFAVTSLCATNSKAEAQLTLELFSLCRHYMADCPDCRCDLSRQKQHTGIEVQLTLRLQSLDFIISD